MKPFIIIGLLLVCQLLSAQTAEATGQEAPAETLDQLTQPVEDATSIKVIVEKNQTIEEYRQKGELILVKVIPNDGVPYFIDPLERDKLQGSGRDLINSGVKPVRWVIKEF
jgi:hypothetical protein